MQAVAQTPAASVPIWQAPTGEIMFRDYPVRAKAAGEQGRVGFLVKLDSKGNNARCEVSRSSGYPQLDQETCQLLLIHAKFEKAKVADEAKVVHNGVVLWRIPAAGELAGASSAQALMTNAAAPKKALPSPRFGWVRLAKQERNAANEKLVCKRVPRTGTLSGFERRCRTVQGWAKSDEGSDFWSELQGRRGSGTGVR
jgi:TonB family protein